MAQQGKLVESYLLSDKHKAFIKKFKKIKGIQEFLNGRAEELNREMQKVGGLMTLLGQMSQELEIPENILRGFADQEFSGQTQESPEMAEESVDSMALGM